MKIKKILKEEIEAADLPKDRYFNRELSWLSFNERVLMESENALHPILERLKFLAISSSNLDEFTMVKVAALKEEARQMVAEHSHDMLSPELQIKLIRERSNNVIIEQQKIWLKLLDELEKQNIYVIKPNNLKKEDREWLKSYFLSNIFPVLTPIAVDAAHPFPFLPNLGLAMILDLYRNAPIHKGAKIRSRDLKAVIPLPQKLSRFIAMPSKQGEPSRFILFEDALTLFQADLFPGCDVRASGIIRITRDSDFETHGDAEDLMRFFESALKKRKHGEIIRLEISEALPKSLLDFVIEKLKVDSEDILFSQGFLGLVSLHELYDIARPDLKFKPINIRFPERIKDYNGDCFAAIFAKDIVVHHPYESFDVVVKFLEQAARDSDVVAIKQTLYRTSNDSPIVKALIEAAEAGKSVTALVELKARFDEEANIRWAKNLERAGAQVIYGLVGLKTHAKLSLIVRKADGSLRSYVHFGTGNYHPLTAKIYTDLSYFTCDPIICHDAALLFNYVTGYSSPEIFSKISVAPLNLRSDLIKLIEQEKENARAGKPAHIWMKMNSLADEDMIDALYLASEAGVSIDLIVRGICSLKPGIKGLSENIRVKSIVGRFLEHSRIFCFGNGHALPSPKAKVYISSADLMRRNLDMRVETMIPVENPTVHEQVLGQIMVANMKDEKQSWFLEPNGTYKRTKFDANSFSAHDFFITNPSLSGRGKALKKVL